jgi:lysine decarboxylase
LTGIFAEHPWLTWDLTELPSLDVLGNPQGVLQQSQAEVARLFEAAHSFYLVNGASVGLMALLLSLPPLHGPKPAILLARNVHRSVVHGIILTGATPYWILPEPIPGWGIWGPLDPEQLADTLARLPDIQAVVMTHPTYEGVASDIQSIAAICQRHGVILIVDEAHGSLWPLSDDLPLSALKAGADAVVHSLHKSAGSLTQTALLHLSTPSRLDATAVQQALNLLHTTSPSYILLAHMEVICAFWGSPKGRALLAQHQQNASMLHHWIPSHLTTFQVLQPPGQVVGFQLFLRSHKMSGESLGDMLETQYGLSFETATPYGVLMLLNPGLPPKALDELKTALLDIEAKTTDWPNHPIAVSPNFEVPCMAMTPREAFFSPGRLLPKEQAVGHVAQQLVAHCPPGIPVLIPGESIVSAHLSYLPDVVQVVA